MPEVPEISVVVPSQDRPLRLRWLLNALEEQTLDRARFEVIVAHDSRGPGTERLLGTHPLAKAGVLRHLTLPPSSTPGSNRNPAWRAARAPLIAFTDDDCRPPPEWLDRALEAGQRHPGAIVQGATRPDPDEAYLLKAAPHARTQIITPPVPWAQTCNIVYPRELIERVGGFDTALRTGEDCDLAVRARATGAPYVAAPEVLTYHAVDAVSLQRRLRSIWRWQDQAGLVKRHPELRSEFPGRYFWKASHALLPLAAAGAVLGRRHRGVELLALPWIVTTLPSYGGGTIPEPGDAPPASSAIGNGPNPRGRVRALLELPGRAAIDATELAALARGSLRHRTLFL